MKCQTSTGILTVKYAGKKVVVSENSHGEEFMTSKKSALHSFKPIDTRTDEEKADDLFKFYLKGENVSTHKSFSQAVIDGDFGENIKWSKS